MLSRIFRPQKLEEVVGNAATIEVIKSYSKLSVKERPRAYLLCGPTGTGKTTLAYLLAEILGVSKQFVVESDMVACSTKEAVEELFTPIKSTPLLDAPMAFILDEAHEMSAKAKSSLLKPLENLPDYAIVILCTNKVDKIPKEIRDRCVTLHTNYLTNNQLELLIRSICKRADLKLEDATIESIVVSSQGCARNAMATLERISALPVAMQNEQIIENELEENTSLDLCQALFARKSWGDVAKIISNLSSNPEGIRLMILEYCNTVLLRQPDINQRALKALQIMEALSESFIHDGKYKLTIQCAKLYKRV